jgi:broad specificity phosphatase PhoE
VARALFLRHGESAHNAHRGAEALDEDEGDRLTERGAAQAEAAGIGLGDAGVTRLLSSPMRRARETADAVGAALALPVETLDYTGEWRPGEGLAQLLARVRRLRSELEADDAGLPLLVGHGIFIRVFLLDAVLGEELEARLGEELEAPALARIWQLGSHNCGLTTFARGESRYPGGTPVPGWTCLTWMARPWDPP